MKKRAKRKIKWAPVLWLAAIITFGAGMMWSPLTAARRIRVLGSETFDRFRIEKELQFLREVPWLRVNDDKLQEKLLFNPEVRTATVRRNPFGRCEVTLEYRRPVARLVDADSVVLDSEGYLFRTRREFKNLPLLQIEGRRTPLATFASRSPLATIAKLCQEVSARESLKEVQIDMLTTGAVCLNFRKETRIELGALEELPEKMRTLDRLLRDDPDMFKKVSDLNLMAPERPVVRKRAL